MRRIPIAHAAVQACPRKAVGMAPVQLIREALTIKSESLDSLPIPRYGRRPLNAK